MSLWISDVNGVLIDSSAVWRAAFAATAARFRFVIGEREFARVKGLWLLAAYRVLDPGGDAYARRQFHLHYVRERLNEIGPYPGVREVLATANAHGIRVAATTSHGEIAESCLVHAGLYPFIDCLVTQEEVRNPKPHPESLRMVLTLFNLHGSAHLRDEALYVGDTRVDVEAGKAAGVRTIGVTYGLSDEAEIAAAEPDHVIHSFQQMQMFMASARHAEPALRVG